MRLQLLQRGFPEKMSELRRRPEPGSPRGRSLLDLKGDAHAYGNGARNSDFDHLLGLVLSETSPRTDRA